MTLLYPELTIICLTTFNTMTCLYYFLVLLAVLCGQGQGYMDIRKCLFDYYYIDLPACPDLPRAIRCVRQITWSSGDEDKQFAVGEALSRLLKDLDDTRCPRLETRRSCITKEIDNCYKQTNIHYLQKERKVSSLCEEYQHFYSCLLTLRPLCHNKVLSSQISDVRESLNSCRSGYFKSYMDKEACYCEMDKCTDEFYKARSKGQYRTSCGLIPSIRQCLQALPSACHGPYLHNVNSALLAQEETCQSHNTVDDISTQNFHSLMDGCLGNFNFLYGLGSYDAACSMVVPVGQCLDSIKPRAPSDVDLTRVIFDTVTKCPLHYLIGVCNFHSLFSCTRDIPFDVTTTSHVTNTCTMTNLKSAKECLLHLEPYCTSRKHLEVLRDDMADMHKHCQFPR